MMLIDGVTYRNHSKANSLSFASLNSVVGKVLNKFLSRCNISRLTRHPIISAGIFLILLFESFRTTRFLGKAGNWQIRLLLKIAIYKNSKDVRSGIIFILFLFNVISFSSECSSKLKGNEFKVFVMFFETIVFFSYESGNPYLLTISSLNMLIL